MISMMTGLVGWVY